MFAKGALTSVIGPFVSEARDAAFNAAQDTLRSTVAGKMSIEEWADVVIEGIDHVKERALEDVTLRFIGGKLKFSTSGTASDLVVVSFQLYFQDELNKWQKAEANSDIPASKFTPEAMIELRSKGEIIFEVE